MQLTMHVDGLYVHREWVNGCVPKYPSICYPRLYCRRNRNKQAGSRDNQDATLGLLFDCEENNYNDSKCNGHDYYYKCSRRMFVHSRRMISNDNYSDYPLISVLITDIWTHSQLDGKIRNYWLGQSSIDGCLRIHSACHSFKRQRTKCKQCYYDRIHSFNCCSMFFLAILLTIIIIVIPQWALGVILDDDGYYKEKVNGIAYGHCVGQEQSKGHVQGTQ